MRVKRRRKKQKNVIKKKSKKSLNRIWISLALALTHHAFLDLYPSEHLDSVNHSLTRTLITLRLEMGWAGSLLASSPVRWAVVSSFYFRCHAIAKNSMSQIHRNSSSRPSFFLHVYCKSQRLPAWMNVMR